MPERIRRYYDFFQPLIEELKGKGFADRPIQRFGNSDRSFPSHLNSGIIRYAASLEGKNDAWVTLHIEIETEDKEQTKKVFDALQERREEIEKCLEGEWHWYRHNPHTFSSINLRRDGSINDCPEKLAATREWMLEYLPRLKEVMEPRMEAIMAELERESGEA